MQINYIKILVIIGLLFGCTLSEAQVDVDNTDSNWIRYSQITAKSQRIYDTERFQGDIYLFDNWRSAEFTLPDDSKIIVDSVKLNLLRGNVEVSLGGKHLAIRGSQYNSFTFNDFSDKDVVYKSKHYYFMNGNRLPGIIKTIDVGDYSVLVAYDSGVRKLSQENPLMIDKLKKDLVRVTKLRYIEKDGELSRIKNKKDLLKYFKSKKRIKEYISENKISHKEEDDIVQVLSFAQKNG